MNNLSGVSKIVKTSEVNSLLGGASKSGRIVSGGYRRVHQDGVMMLDRHYDVKDSTFKVINITTSLTLL
jgi:hypothetical protein